MKVHACGLYSSIESFYLMSIEMLIMHWLVT